SYRGSPRDPTAQHVDGARRRTERAKHIANGTGQQNVFPHATEHSSLRVSARVNVTKNNGEWFSRPDRLRPWDSNELRRLWTAACGTIVLSDKTRADDLVKTHIPPKTAFAAFLVTAVGNNMERHYCGGRAACQATMEVVTMELASLRVSSKACACKYRTHWAD